MTIKERRQGIIISQLKEGPNSFDDLYHYLKMHSELTGEDMTIPLEIFKQDCKDIQKKYGVEIVYDNSLKAYRINKSFPQTDHIYFNKDLYHQVYKDLPDRCIPITRLDLHLLTELELTECDLDDLSFLKHCTNLEELNLFSNYSFPEEKQFKPLRSLPFLPALKRLSLHNTGINDLNILSNCPNIETLTICETEPINISPVGKLSKLKKLDLEDFELKGFETLNELPGVENLSFCNMNIQNFPFHKFPNVKIFNCQNVKVENLAGLFEK